MDVLPATRINYTQEILSCLDANISVIDQKGTILTVNSAWENFTRENTLGNICSTKVGANYLDVCQRSFDSGDKRAGISLNGIQSVLQGKKNEFYQEYPCHSPTEKRWFSMSVKSLLPSKKGAVIIHTDISAQIRTVEKLLESEANTRFLFDYSPILIWVEDFSAIKSYFDDLKKSGVSDFRDHFSNLPGEVRRLSSLVKVTQVNKRSLEFYGVESLEELDTNISDWFIEESLEVFEEELIALAQGRSGFEGILPIVTPAGERKHLFFRLSVPHKSMDTLDRVILSFIDITEINETKEQLRLLNEELEQKVMKRTLQLEQNEAKLQLAFDAEVELGELKSRFVAMASHEFRTPLSAILSSVDLLKRYHEMGVSEKQEKHFKRIKESVKNLITILNDFLSLEKMESGEVSITIQKIELGEYIHDILKEVRPWAKEKQKLIHEHQGVTEVLIDPNLTRNILLNLLSNALKYSPEDAIVKLMTQNQNGKLVLKVIDSGIGIPEEDQHRLFSCFFRASNASEISGTGLGLTIVKRYLDVMGGEISLVSQVGQGTTFTVGIPLA